MDHKHAEELRRIAWGASPLDSLSTVAAHVLADDASVALWRERLGIVAEPTPADGIYRLADTMIRERDDAIRRLTERVSNLEGLEASRRAAKDAITDEYWRCQDCGKDYIPVAVRVGDKGYVAYCRDCWVKRDNANARMAGRV